MLIELPYPVCTLYNGVPALLAFQVAGAEAWRWLGMEAGAEQLGGLSGARALPVRELSRGQKLRLAVATALASAPRLLSRRAPALVVTNQSVRVAVRASPGCTILNCTNLAVPVHVRML